MVRLQRCIADSGADPGRTLVLLPYAQLLPLARRVWSDLHPQGFSPRFETTTNWQASISARNLQATDISHDMALDTLTAQQLLAQAGMGDESSLAGLLAEAAQQLAPWAAAAGPQGRGEWASQARAAVSVGMESQALAWEAQVARVAVEWAAVSSYSTDVLFDAEVLEAWDAVALVQGLASDPVSGALKAHWGSKAELFRLDDAEPHAGTTLNLALDHLHFHACADAEDEAQRAAACAIAHVAADRYPLALVSSDRALTRRVRAMLESAGIAMRDENGWKLSTSRAGAALMALLRAALWNASTDAVLNAFKQAPAFAADLQALEQALRKEQIRDWRHVSDCKPVKDSEALSAMCVRIDQVRKELSGSRPLPAWLARMQSVLQTCGWWEALQADEAGAMALEVLRITPPEPQVWAEYVDAALWAGSRMDLSAFSSWVNQVLEAHSFQPAYPDEEQVVILPMSQMLARPFAAVVLAGCSTLQPPDAQLPPVAVPAGWSATGAGGVATPLAQWWDTAEGRAYREQLNTYAAELTAFEAAVAGGVPILRALHESFASDRVESVSGILNGTCNFILTEMERTSRPYGEVLAEAQALGYAEADPTLDVSGGDAAQKLCVLAQLAFGAGLKPGDFGYEELLIATARAQGVLTPPGAPAPARARGSRLPLNRGRSST